jgi:argininosuccinate lyase
VSFDAERGLAALAPGFTQATDLAEALVRKGVPFREAYKAVGALVREAVSAGLPLTAMGERAKALHPELDAAAMAVLDPARAVLAKESAGGTGPRSVKAQLDELTARAARLGERAGKGDRYSAQSLAQHIEGSLLG